MPYDEFEILVGKTLTEVVNKNDEIIFTVDDGTQYKLYYSQDCCESVSVEDVCGDFADLIGSPILKAEERTSDKPDEKIQAERDAEEKANKEKHGEDYYSYTPDSETWTFYELATIKGSVTIRWYGTSNGYYSESVSFVEVSGDNDY